MSQIVSGPTATAIHIDEARMHRERIARARAALRRHGLAPALLFDPINVRYVAVPGAFAVFNLHVTFRWALVPVESEPVLWEYPGALHVTAGRWSGDVRPAITWTFFGSGLNTTSDARVFATASKTATSPAHRPPKPSKPPERSPSAPRPRAADGDYEPRSERQHATTPLRTAPTR
jgi:hypothetical protein